MSVSGNDLISNYQTNSVYNQQMMNTLSDSEGGGSGLETGGGTGSFSHSYLNQKGETVNFVIDKDNPLTESRLNELKNDAKDDAQLEKMYRELFAQIAEKGEKFDITANIDKALFDTLAHEATKLGYTMTFGNDQIGMLSGGNMSKILNEVFTEQLGHDTFEFKEVDNKLALFLPIPGDSEVADRLTVDSDNPLKAGDFAKLPVEEQQMLQWSWSLGYLPDYLMTTELKELFKENVTKAMDKDKLAEDFAKLKGEIKGAAVHDGGIEGIFKKDYPDLVLPSLELNKMNLDGGQLGKTLDEYMMRLLSIATSMQVIVSRNMSKLLDDAQNTDNLLYEKNWRLAEKIFDATKAAYDQMSAAKAAQSRTQSFAGRCQEAWNKFCDGDLTGAWNDVCDMCMELITAIGMITVASIGWLCMNTFGQSYYVVEAIFKQDWDTCKEMWDFSNGLVKDAAKLFKMEKTKFDEDAIAALKESAEKLKSVRESLTDEDKLYISGKDLGRVFEDFDVEEATDLAEEGFGWASWAAPIVSTLTVGVLSAVFPPAMIMKPMMDSSSRLKTEQADLATTLNAYTLYAEHNIAKLTAESSYMAAVQESISVIREKLNDEIEMHNKDLKQIMEYVTELEKVMNNLALTLVALLSGSTGRS